MRAIVVLCFLLEGCFTAHYLAQATRGQVELLEARRPIEDVLRDPKTPPQTRALLNEVAGVKRFAVEHGLKATRNYSRYADLKRDAAVWVVSASEPLALRPKTWWFPITGAVPYLGWFRLHDAQRFAHDLQREGLDVNLRGASAYSTLGFFEDPILSTMISAGDLALVELVNTILHESLHATFYVPGHTDLSESVASFVGDEMTRDWITARDPALLARYDRAEANGKARLAKMLAAKTELEALYRSDRTDKLKEKGAILGRLRRDLGTKRVINNATLNELHAYSGGTKELEALLTCVNRDWPRFLKAIDAWAKTKAPTFATLMTHCAG